MKKELIDFAGTNLEVAHTGDAKQWFMTVEDVARAYGVERAAIMNAISRHRDEIREKLEIDGVTKCDSIGRQQEMRVIYRDGVIKLGYFMRGERAKAFRQFATDLVTQYLDENGGNSADGFMQLLARLDGMETTLNKKLDQLNCVAETVFGDDQKEIQDLVTAVAEKYKVDGRTVWGWVQTECDVSSYKRQNLKVKNFLRNKLGKGLRPVKSEE
jgi:prophage antirepressor-like protein